MSGSFGTIPTSADATFSVMQAQKESQIDDILKFKALKNDSDIKAVAQDFEAVFMAQMVKPMFEGIETDGMFGGGKGEEVFRGMMIEEYGKAIAARNVTGIQDLVARKLIEIQEMHSTGGI